MTNTTITHSSGCACCGDLLRARFDRRRFLHLTATAGKQVGEKQPKLQVELGLMALDGSVQTFS